MSCGAELCACLGMCQENVDPVTDLQASLWLLTQERHPSVQDAARWFDFGHLPAGPMREVSKAACQLAYTMIASLPDTPQLTLGLHDLLRAKDCFVRAALQLDVPHGGD